MLRARLQQLFTVVQSPVPYLCMHMLRLLILLPHHHLLLLYITRTNHPPTTNSNKGRLMIIYDILGFGLALVPSIIAVSMGVYGELTGLPFCWLSNGNVPIDVLDWVSFYGPIAVCLVVGVISMFFVLSALRASAKGNILRVRASEAETDLLLSVVCASV